MKKIRAFPVDKIEKGKNVILYGAGRNGEYLWRENQKLQWCNICAVVDTYYEKVKDFPVEVKPPREIVNRVDYDYIIISILDVKIKNKIYKSLIDYGVDPKRIVDDLECYFVRNTDEPPVMDYTSGEKADDNVLHIGFLPGGVMGDNVISLKLYQELAKLAPCSQIDVFTCFCGFPEVVFFGQKNLNLIIHRVPDFGDRETYDVIIQSHFEPSLIYCNLPRVTKLAPNLAEKMVILYEYQQRDWFFCSPAQYMNRLQWDRAKFNGWNCYTILGSSGAFDIKDSNVDFFVNDEFEERYNELEIKTPYITFNFGASDPLKDGKRQTKMWPYEYHCKLNEMLKKRFPDIQLIQIGADDVTCVPGADKYILGENLEVTKYVLKNAVCHFDCEGGLVHIATQLGTKCFVVFGPTPVGFFGYSQNTNIVSPQCRECCGLIKDWYTRCYKYDRAECMYAISPETVFYEIERYLLNMGEGSTPVFQGKSW